MYDAGYNMLSGGSARYLAHLVAATGPVLGDPIAFEKMLDTFVVVVREVPGVKAMDYIKAAKAYLATLKGDNHSMTSQSCLIQPGFIKSCTAELWAS
jgi:hypothetical protein